MEDCLCIEETGKESSGRRREHVYIQVGRGGQEQKGRRGGQNGRQRAEAYRTGGTAEQSGRSTE